MMRYDFVSIATLLLLTLAQLPARPGMANAQVGASQLESRRQVSALQLASGDDPRALASQLFVHAYGVNPYDDRQFELIQSRERLIRGLPDFSAAVAAGRRAVTEPDDEARVRHFQSRLNSLLTHHEPSDILGLLYFIFSG